MTTKTKAKKAPAEVADYKPMYCQNSDCHKFLGYEKLGLGMVQIKCHRCKQVTETTNFPEMMKLPKNMGKVFCSHCGRFLYDQVIVEGQVQVKCRGCGTWNLLDILPQKGLKLIPDRSNSPLEPS